ncbi:uncharacterized protein LOC142163490 [Nicotiana tabacum]|uniref:Uncharacterized protein LOC142163490 n=1 Tax=Nicotiana tabacum TaxID=4097 RepID=A0AC58RVW2_TOBAC
MYVVKNEHIARSLRKALIAAVQKPGVDGILWHKRLGHTSVSTMKNIDSLQLKDLDENKDCFVCLLAKQSRLVFPRCVTRSSNPLMLLHMDVWGPYKFPTHDRKYYFLTVVDDCSRDVVFKEHLFPFSKSFSLHPINVPAMGSVSFEHEPLQGHAIEHEPLQGHAANHTLEPLQTPAADDASECKVDTSSIHEAHEDDEVNAVCEECNIADAVLSEEASESQQATHDEHAENDPSSGQSLDVDCIDVVPEFHEAHEDDEVDAVYEEGNIVDAVVSEEVSESQQATHDEHAENDPSSGQSLDVECIDVVPECVSLGIRSQEPRRSSRSTKEPIWLQDYVTKKKAHNVALYPISNYLCYDQLSQACKSFVAKVLALTKLQNFTKASRDKRWIEAMKQEIKALEDNRTWEIVDLPNENNTIGSKWVYKIKYKSNGDVERFKVRLVEKGYSQKEGLDYYETFSPVAKMVNVRSVIAVAASKGWNMYQIDVYNAFL